MNSTCELSPDNIFDILTRSSLQTIGKCRLLSKNYNRLTYDAAFTDLHSRRTKTISGYFIQSLVSNQYSSSFVSTDKSNSHSNLSLNFLPEPVKILASTNQGLLLCSDSKYPVPNYYVCKPTTKQWLIIPKPRTRYHTLATGMLVIKSHTLHYKIVRFAKYPKCCDPWVVRCELFDSSTWKWKQLEDIKLPKEEWFVLNPDASVSTCANGSFHWLTNENNIFAFDVKKETCSLFSPPPLFEDENNKGIKLVEYEGKLALICSDYKEESSIELWVMERYDRKEWRKRFTINIESLRMKEPYTCLIAFYNADVALMQEWDYLVSFFNCRNGGIESVQLEKSFNDKCFPFGSDFEPCDQLTLKRSTDTQTKKKRKEEERKRSNINNIKQMIQADQEVLAAGRSLVLSPTFVFLVLLFALVFFCFMLDL